MGFSRLLKVRPAVFLTTGVVIAALAAGAAYATATSSITAASTDTIAVLHANKSLSAAGNTYTTILKLTLPATSKTTHYVFAGQGDMVNFSQSDFTRCHIMVNGTQIASVSADVGNPFLNGAQGPAGQVIPFALAGGATVPAGGGTALVACWHDTSGATPYIDGGASLWAHRTASLTVGQE